MSLRRLYDVGDVCLLGYFSFKRKQQKILTFSDETFSDIFTKMEQIFNPNLGVCVCVGRGMGVILHPPLVGFPLITQKR